MGNICGQSRGGLFGWRRRRDELEPACGLLLIGAVKGHDMQMNIEIASATKALHEYDKSCTAIYSVTLEL